MVLYFHFTFKLFLGHAQKRERARERERERERERRDSRELRRSIEEVHEVKKPNVSKKQH